MKYITKSKMYLPLHPWLKEGLLTSTGAKWQSRRKILTPAFHFNILEEFVNVFEEHSRFTVEKLQAECANQETNIMPYITEYTLKSVCETAMGHKLDASNASRLYKEALYKLGELVVYRVVRPWLFFKSIFDLTPTAKSQKALLHELHSFTKSVISRRKESLPTTQVENKDHEHPRKKRLAMLDTMLLAQKNGQNIYDDGIQEEVDTFMFGGHDTTSMALVFSLMCLANNQDVQKKVYDEVFEVFGNAETLATIHDFQKLRYMDMFLKEALRLYPSVPVISRYLTNPIRLRNQIIPPGHIIHVHIFDLHRDPNLYPDPEKFDPNRFLPENCVGRHPFAYLPFSAGPRNCIGQKFALLEEKSLICHILRNFILEPVTRPADVVFVCDIVLRPKYPVKIKFRRRSPE